MSIANDMQAIADALSTVDGVTGYKYPPVAFTTGDGWALTPSISRAIGSGAIVTWTVAVILPQDPILVSEWFVDKAEAIMEALSDSVAFVEDVDAGPLETDAGEFYVMLLLMRKEA